MGTEVISFAMSYFILSILWEFIVDDLSGHNFYTNKVNLTLYLVDTKSRRSNQFFILLLPGATLL